MLLSNRGANMARFMLAILLIASTSGCVETSWRGGREPMAYEPVPTAPSASPPPIQP